MGSKTKTKLENKGFLPYKTSWYPSLDPSINPRHYVYLTSLRMEPSVVENAQYIQASSLVAQSHGAFSIETMTQAYESLHSLYLQERQAEVSFINNRLKLNYDPEVISIKELIDSLNKILNFESTYKANIKLTTGGDYGYTFRVMPTHHMLLDSANLNLVKWITKQT